MTTIPAANTTVDLKFNETLCYTCNKFNCTPIFETFRLYLPTFPRKDVSTVLEIPFYLSRKFAIELENYLLNAVHMIMSYDYEPEKLNRNLPIEKSAKFLIVSSKGQFLSKPLHFKANKQEYIFNHLKNHIGSIKVEIFQEIPAIARKTLIENCLALLEIQCCWFINMIGCIYLRNQNIFIRMTEAYCLDLNRLNGVFLREKEIIDQDIRTRVCLFVTAEMLIAIDFLHERRITHRFLCPQNIYVDFRGHLKIGNLFECMNANRDLETLFQNWSLELENVIGFCKNLNRNYLDPEVMKHLLDDHLLEAYLQLDCLSDIFSIAIIVIETLSNINFLSSKMWNDVQKSMFLPTSNLNYIINIYLKEEMQVILRQRLSEICRCIPQEFLAILLLMLQPKSNRMKGLRIHVQRHRYLRTSGCEYKLRLEFVQKHPAFNSLHFNNLAAQSSPILQLLTLLNSS